MIKRKHQTWGNAWQGELNLFQPKRFRELQLRELQTATYNNSRINFLDRFSETNLYSIRKFL